MDLIKHGTLETKNLFFQTTPNKLVLVNKLQIWSMIEYTVVVFIDLDMVLYDSLGNKFLKKIKIGVILLQNIYLIMVEILLCS